MPFARDGRAMVPLSGRTVLTDSAARRERRRRQRLGAMQRELSPQSQRKEPPQIRAIEVEYESDWGSACVTNLTPKSWQQQAFYPTLLQASAMKVISLDEELNRNGNRPSVSNPLIPNIVSIVGAWVACVWPALLSSLLREKKNLRFSWSDGVGDQRPSAV